MKQAKKAAAKKPATQKKTASKKSAPKKSGKMTMLHAAVIGAGTPSMGGLTDFVDSE